MSGCQEQRWLSRLRILTNHMNDADDIPILKEAKAEYEKLK
jgi:hypothetical protein